MGMLLLLKSQNCTKLLKKASNYNVCLNHFVIMDTLQTALAHPISWDITYTIFYFKTALVIEQRFMSVSQLSTLSIAISKLYNGMNEI